jgi:hypothetical protein
VHAQQLQKRRSSPESAESIRLAVFPEGRDQVSSGISRSLKSTVDVALAAMASHGK